MNDIEKNNENIPELIDKVLKTNDPAVVGLRRIIKRKSETGLDFPAREASLEEFEIPGKSRVLNDDERRILVLEKKVIELENKIKKQGKDAKINEEGAFKRGISEGVKSGKEKGVAETTAVYEKKIDAIQAEVGQFIKNIEDEKQLLYTKSEHLLLNLSIEIAKKIIQHELTINHDIVINVLKQALKHISDRERIVIHVNPTDVVTITNRKDFWSSVTDQLKNISIEEDERIEQGGCLIESNSGQVDARFGVQLSELKNLIEKEWENVKMSIESNMPKT